ncbi:hypothetical protein SHKM778_31070 [Streptomyces sp. KM77-8]|uniref:Uncharacterized protein n=1 Tax=Streptomyces haneummycinicus TaxID=3074435 RepID=A0AAT9HH29_9ACTN
MPGSGSLAHGSDQARTVRSTQSSSTEGAFAPAVRVCAPYWQAWRRRRPSYTSICQVSAAWLSGSFTFAWTVGRCPASAGNDQYR